MPSHSSRPPNAAVVVAGPSVLRWSLLAFLYWLAFMTVLEPGNVRNDLAAGGRPHWGHEATRLVGAALLGAAVTPLLLALANRLPIEGAQRWRNLALQALAVLCLAPGLIVVSCLLAAWVLSHSLLPSWADIHDELLANSLLLVFCLSLFLGCIQLARRLSPQPGMAAEDGWLRRVAVKDRGRLTMVELDTVERIETQGNYQALHTGEAVHLLRETSARLESRLDPARFVRVHRRAIVAADRVRRMEVLPNGDAMLGLASGARVRLSRRYRDALKERLRTGPAP